jgi:hypothetical protein
LENMPETEIIFSMHQSPKGGFEARALGHPLFTQSESMEELRIMVRAAARCHFNPGEVPSVIRLHIVKDEVMPALSCRGT